MAFVQATSPARTGMQSSSTGQYLPGLAPATELRKRTSEMRQQHMAKLQRLAGDRAAASSGASSGKIQNVTCLAGRVYAAVTCHEPYQWQCSITYKAFVTWTCHV